MKVAILLRACSKVRKSSRYTCSYFNVFQNLSIRALSKGLPFRDMLPRIPCLSRIATYSLTTYLPAFFLQTLSDPPRTVGAPAESGSFNRILQPTIFLVARHVVHRPVVAGATHRRQLAHRDDRQTSLV